MKFESQWPSGGDEKTNGVTFSFLRGFKRGNEMISGF